jgi:excinuclease UvrABC ATPase subunit
MTEEEREPIDQRIIRQVLSSDPAEVQQECDEIRRLHAQAEDLLKRGHHEAKFTELLKVL